MDQDEYREVARSLVLKIIASALAAAATAALSFGGYLPLDIYSAALIGFLFLFCVGSKFFPESTKFIGRRARNYRRGKRGLEPLDVDDEPTAEVIPNFQRKT